VSRVRCLTATLAKANNAPNRWVDYPAKSPRLTSDSFTVVRAGIARGRRTPLSTQSCRGRGDSQRGVYNTLDPVSEQTFMEVDVQAQALPAWPETRQFYFHARKTHCPRIASLLRLFLSASLRVLCASALSSPHLHLPAARMLTFGGVIYSPVGCIVCLRQSCGQASGAGHCEAIRRSGFPHDLFICSTPPSASHLSLTPRQRDSERPQFVIKYSYKLLHTDCSRAWPAI
jgi:hypothetical protein